VAEIVYVPPTPHECKMPPGNTHRVGTIVRCGECGRYSRFTYTPSQRVWAGWARMSGFEVFIARFVGEIPAEPKEQA